MPATPSDRTPIRDDTLVLVVALVVMLGTLIALLARPLLGV